MCRYFNLMTALMLLVIYLMLFIGLSLRMEAVDPAPAGEGADCRYYVSEIDVIVS